jgi:hypothetical protein
MPDGTGERVIPLWRVLAKFGTHGSCVLYLFDYPEVGLRTTAIKCDTEGDLRYAAPRYSVYIWKIDSYNMVFVNLH